MRGIVLEIGGEKMLLVADTHVGYEAELRLKGIYAVSQTQRLLESLKSWGEEAGANSIAILGDIKHELPTPRETAGEVREFLKALAKAFEKVILIPGNHDSLIGEISQGIDGVYLLDSRGLLLEGPRTVLLLHGHAKPRLEDFQKTDVVVMGHTHPAVPIVDEVGYITREHAIIKTDQDKGLVAKRMFGAEAAGRVRFIVLPASHPLITGFDVVNIPSLSKDDRTILKYLDLSPEKVEVYLTDFTYLGTLDVISASRGRMGPDAEAVESLSSAGYD